MGNDETHKCPACGRVMPVEIVNCAACGGHWEPDGRFVPFSLSRAAVAEPAVEPAGVGRARSRRTLLLILAIAVFDLIVGAILAILFATGALG